MLPRVYRLTSRHTGDHMSCVIRSKQHHLVFTMKPHVENVMKHSSETARVEYLDVNIVKIYKHININKLPCKVTEAAIERMLDFPKTEGVHIAFLFDIVKETDDALFLDCVLWPNDITSTT